MRLHRKLALWYDSQLKIKNYELKMQKDYYETLGVNKGASKDEIKGLL